MRILLTGVSGQVGGALRAPLTALGEVVPADRTNMDLSKPELISSALDAVRPDLIVNPAAYTAVDRAEQEAEMAYRVNAEAPRALAEWAARHKIPLIHFSTDYVFDGSGDQPWREDDPTGPLSIYGASKLAGEVAVKGAGGDHLIIRTAWVFAAQGRNFLTTIARLARERSELRVVVDEIGAPTSAEIIARGVIAMLSSENGKVHDIPGRFGSVGGLVHLCASGTASWFDFARAIVDGLRGHEEKLAVRQVTAIKSSDYPTRVKRPKNSRLDMSRLRLALRIETPDWQEGVEQEIHKFCMLAKRE
ncbi:dTDP-4-dehydrorhamnose reductase [Bradyrhizobium jicamae]|uniref:dTDP-4-dehydrorhamnose reductase n=1 Tax=Bradyrhizobium jicamae TaxID=280332 RepID=A0ABS5FUS2_9BRAD|nr:dTDP-4-dehydrorhamnose reductase [Bradyrhizobium jicamae]